MANPLQTLGAEGSEYALNNYWAGNAKPDWSTAMSNATAFGTNPPPTYPWPTIGQTTGQAIAAGQQVANQIPGYAGDVSQIGANIQSETAGQIPASVQQQIDQQAAERGVAIGSPGSPNANASLLQSLGLTSLNLTNTGQQNLESFLPTIPGYNIAQNPEFYTSTGQQYEAGVQNALNASAPNPAAAAQAGLAAAQAGMGAGGGITGGALPPSPSTYTPTNQGAGDIVGGSTGEGEYINGIYYPPGQGPGATMPGGGGAGSNPWDDIINAYAGTVGGGGGAAAGASAGGQ